ncbi:MAG: flagellar filament capping protein FliD [Proteobacteria bacterium]|nr:flagellar filament capping protein FliD [Pseudomonadota bacterium]
MAIAQFSGLATGIDSKALIDAIIESRASANVKRQSQIDHYNTENSALDELNTKILALNDLLDEFRTANAGGISKKATSSDPTKATASAGSGANSGNYAVTVTSVANTSTGSFDQEYDSLDSYVSTSGSGTVTIEVGTLTNLKTITVDVTANTTTVQDLIDAINDDADAAGNVIASAVNVGTTTTPHYKVVLNTQHQGEDLGTLALSASAPITELQTSTITAASNAVFSLSGIGSVTRSSNTISDVISGVTFNLVDTGSTNVSISNDSDSTADKIQAIVDAYNDIVNYINDNNDISQDTSTKDRTVTFGSLAKTSVDEDFLSSVRLAFSEASSDSGTYVRTFSELGVSTNRDGTLSFDADEFKSQVGNDAIGAAEVLTSLADSLSGVSGTFYSYTKLDGLIDITQESNTSQITLLNDAIDALDRQNEKLRDILTQQFASLESLTNKLQQAQSSISALIR